MDLAGTNHTVQGQVVPARRVDPWAGRSSGFHKARPIIQCRDSELRAFDRKLLNVILARSQDRLKDDPNRVFFAHCTDLRREVGWSGHRDNQEIFDGLLRLQKTVVEIGYLSSDDEFRRSRINLLTQTDVPEREGVVYWKWNSDIAGLLGDPQHFARIFLRVVASLSGEASLRLYENLAVYAQSEGYAEFSLEDLKELLAAGHQKVYERWHEFDRRILQPALKDVNKHAPFEVEMIPQRADRGKVVGVRFTMRAKHDWESANLELTSNRGEAPSRASLSPSKVRALVARLSSRSLKRFAEQFPGVDLHIASMIWAEDAIVRDREVKRPSVAFESWMRAAYPLLRDGRFQPDVLWGVSVLSQMNPNVRNLWKEIAQRQGKIKVPDASADHIHLWIDVILADLKADAGYDEARDGLGTLVATETENQMELGF